jgi:hypothetical protein
MSIRPMLSRMSCGSRWRRQWLPEQVFRPVYYEVERETAAGAATEFGVVVN